MLWPALKKKIDKQLGGLGLCFLGIANPKQPEALERYKKWLLEERHGEMSYLENGVLPRENPELVHPGSSFVLLVGFRYGARESRESFTKDRLPRVAQYARLKDYHRFMRKNLDSFSNWLIDLEETKHLDLQCRPTVDSAPVLERAMAASAASGFIGKNTCYIHHDFGSFVLLAEVFVSASRSDFVDQIKLEKQQLEKKQRALNSSEQTEQKGCGTCRRCQVHCPTGALDEDYRIDARKCLAYWSIEHRGPVPLEFWPHFAKYAFGCDICQNVCPKNRGVSRQDVEPFVAQYKKVGPWMDLGAVLSMDQKGYETMFGGTPLTRAKFVGLKRNAIIASVALAKSRVEIEKLQESWLAGLALQWRREDDAKGTLAQTLANIPTYINQFT